MEFLTRFGFWLPAVIALVLFILIVRIPIKWFLRLLLNICIGFLALLILNFAGSFIGVTIGVNWITALVVGVLGLPGVALLLILRWLALI